MRAPRDDGGHDTATIDAVFGGAHAVIANPPYIVPPDGRLAEAYRRRYCSATRKYGLGVPFTERLFQLAVPDGFVGQITSNAFMKREHGKALVERVLSRLDLTTVVDTSGAFIPGHGTPTVIMFGRNRRPSGAPIRVVMSKRGEPEKPKEAIPAGVTLAAALAKPVKAAAATLRLPKDEALRCAGAWALTALMAKALEARRVLPAPLPWGEGIAAVCDRLRCLAPETEVFDEDTAVSHSARHLAALPPDAERALLATLDAATPPACADVFGRSGWASTDTDWIGDLHQGFDVATVKRFAFCQTPGFVRDFILDHTLEPAIEAFGPDLRVLDPACGTGHLLLGAFWRLYQRHVDPADGPAEMTYVAAAQRALRQLRAADLNPAVVAILRYRLLLAYCDAAAVRTVASVPDDLGLHAIAADALLAGEPKPSPPSWPKPAATVVVPPRPAANDQQEQLSLFGRTA